LERQYFFANNIVGGDDKIRTQKYELFKKFSEIRKKGWIESMRNGSTGIGYTLEYLLNIEENSLPIADYNGIEIKAMRILSKKRIHLFNAEPDGDFLFPNERILKYVGYPSKKNPNYKVFLSAAYGNGYTNIGYSKKVRLFVDRKKEKINFIVVDRKYRKLPVNVSWSFTFIKSKIEQKIKNLAVIKTEHKFINNKEYFYYKYIEFYEIKSFDTFLKLIEDGTIKVCFKISVFADGIKEGQIDNHGTDFSIKEDDLEKLYTKINIFK
jgi:hypothetical protein